MTWTLDWKDEPAKPAKEFGLDEFLAFEASLREDAPAPATADPVAFSHEPEASSYEPLASSPEPEAFSPEPEAFSQQPVASSPEPVAFSQQPAASSPEVQFELRTAPAVATTTTEIDPDRDSLEDTMRRMAQERRAYLQTYNHHFGQNQARMQQGDLERPAFERQGWDLDASARYSQQNALGDHMVRGEKNDLEFRPNNSFLHDNVD
jgi:cell division protein FtsZ